MNRSGSFILCLTFLFQLACKCEEEVRCEGISQSALDQIPGVDRDEITFTNGSDSSFTFYRSSYIVDGSEVKECADYGDGCNCPECDAPRVSASYQLDFPLHIPYRTIVDSSWNDTINSTIIRRDSSFLSTVIRAINDYTLLGAEYYEEDRISISYEFLECPNSFELIKNNDGSYTPQIQSNDSLLSTFSTPENTYSNVIVSDHSSLLSNISNLYYSLEVGVIAFESYSDSTLFYRLD